MDQPENMKATDAQSLPVRRSTYFMRGWLWGMLGGLIVVVPYVAVAVLQYYLSKTEVSSGLSVVYFTSILILLPLVQGAASGLGRGKDIQTGGSGFGLVCLIFLADVIVSITFLREGAVCLIMASPLLIAIIGTGYMAGRTFARRNAAKTLSVSLIPLIVLAVAGETLGPKPDAPQVITDQITINAPPEYVWHYVVGYPENTAPAGYWIWQMGLPTPINSTAQSQLVGATRFCRFTGGQSYEERITVLEPQKRLVYDVTRQMTHPEIAGHVTFDQGEIDLTPNRDGSTTVTMTGRYRLHVRPAPYFAWWAADVTRHVHFRVMGYMKALAERDYRSEHAL